MKRNSEFLQEDYDEAIKMAEIPYKANRQALFNEIGREVDNELIKLQEMLDGLSKYQIALEKLRNHAYQVIKAVNARVR